MTWALRWKIGPGIAPGFDSRFGRSIKYHAHFHAVILSFGRSGCREPPMQRPGDLHVDCLTNWCRGFR
jgi:hypothetical protein